MHQRSSTRSQFVYISPDSTRIMSRIPSGDLAQACSVPNQLIQVFTRSYVSEWSTTPASWTDRCLWPTWPPPSGSRSTRRWSLRCSRWTSLRSRRTKSRFTAGWPEFATLWWRPPGRSLRWTNPKSFEPLVVPRFVAIAFAFEMFVAQQLK